jgi:hypothetical protein
MLLFILNKNVLNLFCKNNVKKDYIYWNQLCFSVLAGEFIRHSVNKSNKKYR